MSNLYNVIPKELQDIIYIRPELERLRKLWQLYLDSYMGGEAYREGGYLSQLPNCEDSEEFTKRKTLAVYDNQCKLTVNNIISKIFSKEPKRSNLDEIIDQICFRDFDNRKISINEFFKLVCTYTLILGEVYVLIDRTVIQVDDESDMTLSLADLQDYDITYNAQIIMPQYVPAVEFGVDGEISAIAIETSDEFWYWNNTTIQKWERDLTGNEDGYVSTSQFDNPWEIVPAIRYTIDINQDNVGDSALADIAPINRLIYNLDSAQSWDLITNSQNIVLLPLDSELAESYAKWGLVNETSKKIDLKGKPYIPVSPGQEASYLTKNLEYHKYLDIVRQRLSDAIDKLSNSVVQKLVEQSGISKAYDENNRSQNLQTLSYIFEGFERLFIDFIAYMMNIELDSNSIEINYNHTFDMLDKSRRLDNLIKVRDVIMTPAVQRTIDKIIVQDQLKQDLTENEYNELINAIDEDYDQTAIETSQVNTRPLVERNLDEADPLVRSGEEIINIEDENEPEIL